MFSSENETIKDGISKIKKHFREIFLEKGRVALAYFGIHWIFTLRCGVYLEVYEQTNVLEMMSLPSKIRENSSHC